MNPKVLADPDGLRAKAIGAAAHSLGLKLQNFEVTKPEGIEALTAIGRAGIGALAVRADFGCARTESSAAGGVDAEAPPSGHLPRAAIR
jgi:hypothetical protein